VKEHYFDDALHCASAVLHFLVMSFEKLPVDYQLKVALWVLMKLSIGVVMVLHTLKKLCLA
jgi:hypothetical protein